MKPLLFLVALCAMVLFGVSGTMLVAQTLTAAPSTTAFAPAKNIAIPLTGGTVVLSAAAPYQIINPAGTLATLTITLPAAPANNQMQYVSFMQVITAATFNGGTILGAPASLAIGGTVGFVFDAGTAAWYRIQ
jgi:hypothetical protein